MRRDAGISPPLGLEYQPLPCHNLNMLQADKYQQNALTTALLMDAGITLMRENIRRRNPTADGPKTDELLEAWLHRQDDPIPGDTAGHVRVRKQTSWRRISRSGHS
jgi:Rv0078B-related antitoxin